MSNFLKGLEINGLVKGAEFLIFEEVMDLLILLKLLLKLFLENFLKFRNLA